MAYGPAPKDPKTRQRRNMSSTARVFVVDADADDEVSVPPIPDGVLWCPRTADHWVEFWSSPMRDEFLTVDMNAIHAYFVLVDMYWSIAALPYDLMSDRLRGDLLKLSAELRQQRTAFGLTPMDRRRLQWQVEQTESARRRSKTAIPTNNPDSSDPRLRLA